MAEMRAFLDGDPEMSTARMNFGLEEVVQIRLTKARWFSLWLGICYICLLCFEVSQFVISISIEVSCMP